MAGKGNYNNGHSSDYSDDFEEDVESEVRVASKPAAATQTDTPQVQRTMQTTPRNTKSQLPQKKRITKGTAIKTRVTSDLIRVSKVTPYDQGKPPAGISPRDRLLSSKKRAIKTLQNELADAKRELGEMKKENRLLNRLQVRQERELDKVYRKEGELPQILMRHAEEVRALKEQHRRSHEAASSYQQKANDLRQELLRVSDNKKRLEEVVKKRHLLEREALTIELQEANDRMEEKNRRIAELERGIDVGVRTHAQEVRALLQKNRALSVEAEGLRSTTKRIQTQLREKEREMDVMNIYSQRIVKNMPRGRLAAVESQTHLSCPPYKTVSLETRPHVKATGSQTDTTQQQQQQQQQQPVQAGTQTDITMVHRSSASPVDAQKVAGQPLLLGPGGKEKTTAGDSTKKLSIPTAGDSAKKQPIPTDAVKGKQTLPAASDSKVKSPSSRKEKPTDVVVPDKEVASREGERHKKDILLAKLRAMDSQKGPPSSNPIPPGSSLATKSTAVNTSIDHQEALPTSTVASKQSTKSEPDSHKTAQPQPDSHKTAQSSNDNESQRKKKLLLAKLMAIDNESSPPKDVSSTATPVKADSKPEAPMSRSNTSLQSWPDKVENMHRGKPAYSTEDDPFGSKHSLGRKATLKEGETFVTETKSDKKTQVPRFGRRQQHNTPSQKHPSDAAISEKSSDLQGKGGPYKPSFGRRAVNEPKNEFVFGGMNLDSEVTDSRKTGEYPWETRINVSSNPGRRLLGGTTPTSSGVQRTLESGSLLPLRPKAEPVMNSFDVMPGTLATEPDDIEELVL